MTAQSYFDDRTQELFDEADTNYQTGRYENAARGFEFLARHMLDNHMYEEMVYCYYRAICSWYQEEQLDEIIKNYHNLAIHSLKLGTMIAVDTITKTIPITKKAEILWYTQKNLQMLQEKEKRTKILLLTLEINRGLSQDTFIKEDDKLIYLKRNLEILKELKQVEKFKDVCIQYANLVHQKAETTRQNGGLENEYIIADQLMEAAAYFEFGGDKMMAKNLQAEALKMAPKLDPMKYQEMIMALQD